MRIGLIEDYSLAHLQPAVDRAVRTALDTLSAHGAVPVEVRIGDIEGNISAQLTVEAAEPSACHQRNLRERPGDYGDDVRLLLQAGELLLSPYPSSLRLPFPTSPAPAPPPRSGKSA